MPDSREVAFQAARAIAGLELIHGFYALSSPISFAKYFGMDGLGDRESRIFSWGVGSRNITVASSVLYLSLSGAGGRANARPIGVILGALVAAGLADAYSLYIHGGRKVATHALVTVALAGIGFGLLR